MDAIALDILFAALTYFLVTTGKQQATKYPKVCFFIVTVWIATGALALLTAIT